MDKLIRKSFNFGLNAAKERQFITVNAASNYFFDIFYNQLQRNFKDGINDISVRSYANYLTSVSLLSYTLYKTGVHNDIVGAKFLRKIIKNKPKEIKGIEIDIFYSHKHAETGSETA